MKQLLSVATIVAMLLSCSSLFAADEKKAPTLDDYAEMDPGVYNVKTNEQGEIVSVIVVGKSRVSTVLGSSKGKSVAQRKAALDCDAQFTKWCKNELEVKETDGEETIVVLQGSGNGEEAQQTEEGKASETYTRTITSYATQTLRGMQVIYSQFNAETKEYTVIKGLNMKKANAIKKLAQELNDDQPRNEQSPEADSGKPAPKSEQKSEKHVAPEADEFM